ncbi:MAG: YncE family protein [Acidobacteria bacterium]|nr:YncE family protein [Acidobacteriota bacterium]
MGGPLVPVGGAAGLLAFVLVSPGIVGAELLIVANDEKISFTDEGTELRMPERAERDTVCVYDIASDPEAPSLVATLSLQSSVYGPPTNVVLTPDETLAFVTNPVRLEMEGGVPVVVPGDELHVIDLEQTPRHVATLTVGRQPSGMDVTPDGRLLLIANRADETVSVLRIGGKAATFVDTVQVGTPAAAVRVTPDGRRALIVFKGDNKVGVLHIRGETVTYDPGEDINVGISPDNVDVTPSGDLALVANSGVTGGNDGHADSVSVIDLTVDPPRVIDVVGVGDGPEGLAISPTGALAVVALIDGSQNARANPRTAWAAKKNGKVAVLEIRGKTVRKTGEVEVGGMPEGVVFSPDGRYVYVGNFLGRNLSILRVEGESVVDTGKTIDLDAGPAAMRGSR